MVDGIINYENQYFNKLVNFIKNVYPERKNIEDNLMYILGTLPIQNTDYNANMLAIENDEIIGIMLMLSTSVYINSEIIKAYWSYDTHVLQEFRKSGAGLELTENLYKSYTFFAIGLSPISAKIQKLMKANFFAKSYTLYKYNIWSYKLITRFFPKIFKVNKIESFDLPKQIKVKGRIFYLVENLNEIILPDDGIWNKKKNVIEFCRDKSFINKRFFENGKNYFIYQEKSDSQYPIYFVVIPQIIKNMNVLTIIDFRFDIDNEEDFKVIIKAASKIALKYGIPLTFIRTTLEQYLPTAKKNGFVLYPKVDDLITNYPVLADTKCFVTMADADQDLH